MVWLYPAALAALVAVAGPVVVHLLRRQRARTLIVPTIRFVPGAEQSVVRIRRPADAWLLLLRMAIIASAALAVARPLLLTGTRMDAWDQRLARVVVVHGDGIGAEAVAAELDPVAFPHRIDTTDLASGLRRAAGWLETSPPARREIVALSEFRRGALAEADVNRVPAAIGVRFVIQAPGETAQAREMTLPPVLSQEGPLLPQVRIDEVSTGVTYRPEGVATEGLRLLTAPQDAAAAAALLRIVSRVGAPAPQASQPIVVRFPGGEPLPSGPAEGSGWATAAALRLLQAADAADLPLTARGPVPNPLPADPEHKMLGPGGPLLVEIEAAPDTIAAAESLKAVLDARVDARELAEQEVARIPAAMLSAWTRQPAPADTGAWRQSDESDGRWVWLAGLILLGVEALVRRSPAATVREAEAHAA